MDNKKEKFPSELRKNIVSQDWVVIATGRARRPETFQEDKKSNHLPKSDCPFEKFDPEEQPLTVFLDGKEVELEQGKFIPKDWTTISLPNKYPAFTPGGSLEVRRLGPYEVMDGVGFHEVVVTRDHDRDIPEFTESEAKELVDMYQERYLDLSNEKFVNHISIFKNKGSRAGATLSHPHSQIIGIPVTDPQVQRSLNGSLYYWEEYQKCIHCDMLSWELKEKHRVLYENDCYVAVCPFASTVAFEVRIYPKTHFPYFERADDYQKKCFADALLVVMKKLKKALNDPDYNYFIHTSPADGKNYDHYHWHLEILPRTSTFAGFELGTGIEISTIEPEKAAEFLREN